MQCARRLRRASQSALGACNFFCLTRKLFLEILKEEENYFCSRGTNTTSIDFGFRPTVIIGDRVWLDADGDGMQSSASSEPGFANVVVQLVDRAANAIIGSTLTDELCVSLFVAFFFSLSVMLLSLHLLSVFHSGVYLFNSLAFPRMEPNTNYEVTVALAQPTSPTDATPRFAGYRLVKEEEK